MTKKKSTDNFYHAFEERYRGPRELIKSRLKIYVRFIEPLKDTYADSKAVDLGCGRGEWLELVNELGFEGIGVDLNEDMLAACRELNLKVESKEAIAYLKTLPNASVAIVSGFHVAEHIAFSELQILVQEALRVLLPGGLLILETPNPENMVVAGANFYLDPTHERPIPPQLLSFLPEHYGFERVKVLRLQESAGLARSNALTLLNVLNGVSPDYAVVAQKLGPDEILAATLPAFTEEYGVTLESLAGRYDQQAEAKAQQAEVVAQQAEAKAQQAEVVAQQAEAKAQQAEVVAQQAEAKAQQAEVVAQQAEAKAQQAEVVAQQAEVVAQQAEAVLIAIHNSSSWRLTAPLRIVGRAAKIIFRLPRTAKSKSKEKIKLLLAHAKLYINRRPKFRRVALAALAPFPVLKRRLKLVASTLEPRPAFAAQQLPNMSLTELDSTSTMALQESMIQAAARWQLGKRIDV